MYIWGPLLKTSKTNQIDIVIRDSYPKLARPVPDSKTNRSHPALKFIENWIMSYDIPNFLLAGMGPQFVSKLFKALCDFSGAKELTPTAGHRAVSSQTERYKKTIIAQLPQYLHEHQSNFDLRVRPLTHMYNRELKDLFG